MSISDDDYRRHMDSVIADGFVLDPPGYERLSLWTYILLHLVKAKASFQSVLDHPGALGDLDAGLQQQAFFIAGIMAYGRCYASSGQAIPMLDAKKVYQGSLDGMEVHRRLMELRNTVAAHTDRSDLVRLTLAVKEEADRIVVRQLGTTVMPTNEIPDFLEAVEHTQHFVTVALDKQLDHIASRAGKPVALD